MLRSFFNNQTDIKLDVCNVYFPIFISNLIMSRFAFFIFKRKRERVSNSSSPSMVRRERKFLRKRMMKKRGSQRSKKVRRVTRR